MVKAKTATAKNRVSANGRDTAQAKRTIGIEPLNIGKIDVAIKSLSLLCVHKFDEKSKTQMLEKQMKSAKSKQAKEARCPEQEFLGALYWAEGEPPEGNYDEESKTWAYDPKVVAKSLKSGVFGVPITGFKNAMISACRATDFTMTEMKQLIFVESPEHHDLAIIKSDSPPEMREDMVRLATGTPMVRFRPYWPTWSTTLRITYNANMVSDSQVLNLLNLAGYSVGICEGRPEKSSLGWGRFTVC